MASMAIPEEGSARGKHGMRIWESYYAVRSKLLAVLLGGRLPRRTWLEMVSISAFFPVHVGIVYSLLLSEAPHG